MDVREETLPDAVEQREETFGADGHLQVEAVGVELGNARGRDDDARSVAAKLNHVQGRQQRLAKGRRDAVVGRRCPCQDVDSGLRLGADDGAAGMRANGMNGYGKVLRHGDGDLCVVYTFKK